MPTTATPNILTSPGYLFLAPLGSTVPTNTVAGSKFTDAWPVAWINLGATEDGSTFNYSTTVQPISVAEFLDPVKQATTGRDGSIAFALADWTLSNLQRATNGGIAALTPTSGTGDTSLFTYSPPAAGSEVRAMVGWESLDSTARIVAYQTINAGQIASAFKKAPVIATMACEFRFEVPASGTPWQAWTAGTTRG